MIRTILTGIGALSLVSITGFVLIVAVDAWCHRKGCRPTRESHRTRKCGDDGSLRQRARVGRPGPVVIDGRFRDGNPRPFDIAWRENWYSWDELAGNLTDGGKSILEMERTS